MKARDPEHRCFSARTAMGFYGEKKTTIWRCQVALRKKKALIVFSIWASRQWRIYECFVKKESWFLRDFRETNIHIQRSATEATNKSNIIPRSWDYRGNPGFLGHIYLDPWGSIQWEMLPENTLSFPGLFRTSRSENLTPLRWELSWVDKPTSVPGSGPTAVHLWNAGSVQPVEKKKGFGFLTREKKHHLKIIGSSKLAILRTLTLLYRFKPFHWRVQDP